MPRNIGFWGVKPMKRIILAAAAIAVATPVAPVFADPPPWAPAHGRRAKERVYDDYGRYYEPRRLRRADRIWRGRDGRSYCRRDNGPHRRITGGAAGALSVRAASDGSRGGTVGGDKC